MPLLSLDRVGKTYYRGGRHRVCVLRDASLNVEPGELVAIVGDPMAGKTTLLRIAAGLEAPAEGTVRLNDHPLPATDDLDPRLAFVARTPPPRETSTMRMLDFVSMGLLDRMPARSAQQRATDALDAFGIADLARATWHELSDVERTLIRIAQAVVRRPAAMFVDDVVLGLGISHTETVLAQLHTATREHDTAAIVTVSDLSEALRADTTHTLNAGMLIPTPSAEAGGRVVDFPARRSPS